MNAQTEKIQLEGGAGVIQALRDGPVAGTAPRGVAVIAHPHPLFGGTMDNKVVQTLARAFIGAGWAAVRFNFRGVGASEGVHDEGRGEAEDMLAIVQQVAPEGPLAIAGFSFGAFVAINALQSLWDTRDVQRVALVGASVARVPPPALPEAAHDRVLLVHGEQDDTVALAAVLDWARPQSLPVTVVPGGGHFFHGQLPLLKNLVARHLRAG
ncbi:alpha/beta hydrolase [Variovorax sp. J22G21]|uniref:alpha/beta hydrolase n=1 Tax=Variovorax fucosicus TaxID=3053517 RepID=UPI0025769803|nr:MULTISPECIES: alpha/beta hydrolase [unclassified Variovorax]MDM0038888.1 alpha/beta hydrolase [Variovorax sp. J22R193]MDM0055502.1 alpha/beta hydrolase [Variovorax sp. J22G47]MDM0063664.1 alpha/beta hydrolase [Variovorax sp. J22G21]